MMRLATYVQIETTGNVVIGFVLCNEVKVVCVVAARAGNGHGRQTDMLTGILLLQLFLLIVLERRE